MYVCACVGRVRIRSEAFSAQHNNLSFLEYIYGSLELDDSFLFLEWRKVWKYLEMQKLYSNVRSSPQHKVSTNKQVYCV
jgi:hypothetical protein